MDVFILRHGDAESFASVDSLRQLTAAGRANVQARLDENSTDLSHVDCLLVSPYLRAQQTAEIVNTKLKCASETLPDLVPNASVETLADTLNNRVETHQSQGILLVSHQPLVSRLIQWLCDSRRPAPFLETSGLAKVELDIFARDCGQLHWVRSE